MYKNYFLYFSLSLDSGEDAAAKIEVRNDIKGRLLTPEEGCGGGTAKNGD